MTHTRFTHTERERERGCDTVWVLVYCSPSMMHKIGAICTQPMWFALSSIREEECKCRQSNNNSLSRACHMRHANLLQQQFLPKNGPHCVCALIFRWSLVCRPKSACDICTKFEQSIVLTGTHSARPSECTRLTLAFVYVFVVVIVGCQMARPLIEWISDIWLN